LLDAPFAGRRFDGHFLAAPPASVDPCGENGEFHTFVHTGPIFREPIACETGEIVERDGLLLLRFEARVSWMPRAAWMTPRANQSCSATAGGTPAAMYPGIATIATAAAVTSARLPSAIRMPKE
jgi:Diphthamide synthase